MKLIDTVTTGSQSGLVETNIYYSFKLVTNLVGLCVELITLQTYFSSYAVFSVMLKLSG